MWSVEWHISIVTPNRLYFAGIPFYMGIQYAHIHETAIRITMGGYSQHDGIRESIFCFQTR